LLRSRTRFLLAAVLWSAALFVIATEGHCASSTGYVVDSPGDNSLRLTLISSDPSGSIKVGPAHTLRGLSGHGTPILEDVRMSPNGRWMALKLMSRTPETTDGLAIINVKQRKIASVKWESESVFGLLGWRADDELLVFRLAEPGSKDSEEHYYAVSAPAWGQPGMRVFDTIENLLATTYHPSSDRRAQLRIGVEALVNSGANLGLLLHQSGITTAREHWFHILTDGGGDMSEDGRFVVTTSIHAKSRLLWTVRQDRRTGEWKHASRLLRTRPSTVSLWSGSIVVVGSNHEGEAGIEFFNRDTLEPQLRVPGAWFVTKRKRL
jgi:hypothetical protein